MSPLFLLFSLMDCAVLQSCSLQFCCFKFKLTGSVLSDVTLMLYLPAHSEANQRRGRRSWRCIEARDIYRNPSTSISQWHKLNVCKHKFSSTHAHAHSILAIHGLLSSQDHRETSQNQKQAGRADVEHVWRKPMRKGNISIMWINSAFVHNPITSCFLTSFDET